MSDNEEEVTPAAVVRIAAVDETKPTATMQASPSRCAVPEQPNLKWFERVKTKKFNEDVKQNRQEANEEKFI